MKVRFGVVCTIECVIRKPFKRFWNLIGSFGWRADKLLVGICVQLATVCDLDIHDQSGE